MGKRLHIAEIIARLGKQSAFRPEVRRLLETAALSLERDGDTSGADTIRASLESQSGTVRSFAASETDNVLWVDPAPVSLFLDGDTGAAIERLAAECAEVSAFTTLGIDPPTRAIFVGPSGVGKTLAATWIGWKLGLPVAIVTLDQTVKSYLGKTSEQVAAAMKAATSVPSILFIDEIDGLCTSRMSERSDVGEMTRVTSALLQRLDWLPPSQIVFAATNVEAKVDPAILRRLSYRVAFHNPSRESRARMVGTWLGRAPVTTEAIDRLVDRTDGWTPAEIRAAAMAMGREAIMLSKDRPVTT
jgi:SpoVK/Ycf46/Vps4 family AAA+-type ATPase